MVNKRGMLAGLGEGLSLVGKMGLADSFEKEKEARLQKIAAEAEGRAESRTIASEARRDTRSDVERGQKVEDDVAGEARRLASEKELVRVKAEQERQLKKEERDAEPNISTIAVPASDTSSGGILSVDKTGKTPSQWFDPATKTWSPANQVEAGPAPAIPEDAQALAQSLAKAKVAGKATWGLDSTDFAAFGGSRKSAEAVYLKEAMPDALKQLGYDPAAYGIISAADNVPKAAAANNSSGGLPPKAAASLREGVQTRFGNGQVWMLKGGVPTRVK